MLDNERREVLSSYTAVSSTAHVLPIQACDVAAAVSQHHASTGTAPQMLGSCLLAREAGGLQQAASSRRREKLHVSHPMWQMFWHAADFQEIHLKSSVTDNLPGNETSKDTALFREKLSEGKRKYNHSQY